MLEGHKIRISILQIKMPGVGRSQVSSKAMQLINVSGQIHAQPGSTTHYVIVSSHANTYFYNFLWGPPVYFILQLYP